MSMDTFLDRLMQAESGGQLDAKNPRSTAFGPFQFVESTFLYVARRHFAEEVAGLGDDEVLALRADRAFSRRAARAYTNDNAAHLIEQGLEASSVNLRLAYLVGPAGAVRLLRANGDTPLAEVFAGEVLSANPFMAKLTASGLIAKAALDLSGSGPVRGVAPSRGAQPALVIRCKLGLASCRKWVALQQKKMARFGKQRPAAAQ